MGRPKGAFQTDSTRKKIQAVQLINRLQDHIFKGLALSMSQIRAIDILLKKTIPDLTTTTVVADINVRYVVELPPMLTREEWEKKYSIDHLDPARLIDGTTNGSGNLQ